MRLFSIQLIEQYSGIKSHTIRAWEQRHRLFSPQRDAGNRRHYHIEDLAFILDVAILTRYGYAISSISRFTPDQVKSKIYQLESTAASADIYLNKLLLSFVNADIILFEQVLNEFSKIKDLHATINELIVRFMERVRLLSYTDQSSSTHLTVTIIRKKLLAAIEQTGNIEKNDNTILLFLPKGQHYDLILLYLAYQLQYKGFRVLYLGTNISIDNLQEVVARHRIDAWVTYLAPGDKTDVNALLNFARSYLPENKLLVATSETAARFGIATIHYSEMILRVTELFQTPPKD